MQSTIFSGVRIFGTSPDFVLVVVVTWVLVRGQPEGLLAALVGGAVIAALSGGPRATIVFLFVACSIITGFARDHLPRLAGIIPYLAVAVVTVIYKSILIFWLQTTHPPVYWPGLLLQTLAPAIIFNLTLMVLIFNLATSIEKSLKPPTVEWE